MTNVQSYKVTAEEKIHLKTQWNILWGHTKETENEARGTVSAWIFKKLLFEAKQWWRMSLIPVPRRQRQAIFEDSLVNTEL